MLSKKVCMACVEEWESVQEIPGNPGWVDGDEEHWREGECWCPFRSINAETIRIDEPPPLECPYRLEHAVAKVKEDA